MCHSRVLCGTCATNYTQPASCMLRIFKSVPDSTFAAAGIAMTDNISGCNSILKLTITTGMVNSLIVYAEFHTEFLVGGGGGNSALMCAEFFFAWPCPLSRKPHPL